MKEKNNKLSLNSNDRDALLYHFNGNLEIDQLTIVVSLIKNGEYLFESGGYIYSLYTKRIGNTKLLFLSKKSFFGEKLFCKLYNAKEKFTDATEEQIIKALKNELDDLIKEV